MHPKLKALVLEAARKDREERARFEAEARAIVLCPPDCDARHPRFASEHCHTFLDMWRAAGALDYGYQCRKAAETREDAERLDPRPHLTRAGVRAEHLATLANLSEEWTGVRAVRAWLAQGREIGPGGRPGAMRYPFLVMAGPTRAGKTVAAAAVLEHFIRRYPWNERAGGSDDAGLRPFVLIHSADLVQVARQAKAYSMAGRSAFAMEELLRARAVVLDDVGAERLGAEEVELFQRLVAERHASRRVTVWTSNLTAAELESRLDFMGQEPGQRGRLWRRVAEAGYVVELSRGGSRAVIGGDPKNVLAFEPPKRARKSE
jgi:hypothetical protein